MIGRRMLLQAGLSGGAMALSGCLGNVPMDRQGWGNRLGTTYTLPRWQWAPTNACDLATAVQRAESEHHRIRMTGSGYSFSDVAVNDDWLLSPRALTRVFPSDPCCLKDGADPGHLLRVQTGVTVRKLNAALDERGLALRNMGAFDLQTFVGAASTGTHGSGMAFGPLATQIVSIQVVGPGGAMLQVEPADGITDPNRFTHRLPEAPSVKVTLVQDDLLFNALAVSLGCLGVIYSVTLRAVPKFWLIERRTMTTWEQLAAPGGVVDCIVNGLPIWPVLREPPLSVPACIPRPQTDPEHIEINYTPYPDSDGMHVAMLTQRWRTACEPPSIGGERGSLIFSLIECGGLELDRAGVNLARLFRNTTASIQSNHVRGMQGIAQEYYANRSFDVFLVGSLDDLHVLRDRTAL